MASAPCVSTARAASGEATATSVAPSSASMAGVRGEASCAVHDDTEGLATSRERGVAHREEWVVRQRRADADHDGVGLGTQAVRLPP